jgi:hypothetical protein
LAAINPSFDKLITALRTEVDNEGTLDKEATSYDDIFDAYRLALELYHHKSDYFSQRYIILNIPGIPCGFLVRSLAKYYRLRLSCEKCLRAFLQ